MALFGGVTFQLTGDKYLDKLFQTLPKRVQKKVLRKPLREAVKAVKPGVEAKTPVKSGKLKKSYKVRAGKRSRRRKDQVNVVLLTGKDLFKGAEFYGAFQELGFKLGSRKQIHKVLGPRGLIKVDPRRQIPGKHFMKEGMKAREAQAKQIALEGIKEGIIREATSGSAGKR